MFWYKIHNAVFYAHTKCAALQRAPRTIALNNTRGPGNQLRTATSMTSYDMTIGSVGDVSK